MKTLNWLVGIGCLWLGSVVAATAEEQATNAAPAAIGVYDSRAVAYAHFFSAPCQKALKEKMAAARAAKQAGDTAKFNEYSAALRAAQDQNHRQVFSTAPVDDALAEIKDRLPELQKQAGVTALVSKWDEKTLKQYPNAQRVDVTDQLVRQFIQPNDKQAKMISSIEKNEPIPLEKCEELLWEGKL